MARISVEAQLVKIRKQREALEAKEKALRAKANDKVISEIVALAKKHNVTLAELSAAMGRNANKGAKKVKTSGAVLRAVDKRSKVAPKYRNPDNTTQTWTGRGKTPQWVRALKDAGKLNTAHIVAE